MVNMTTTKTAEILKAMTEMGMAPEELERISKILLTDDSAIEVTVQETEKPNLTKIVSDILHEIGVPAHIKGYQYVRDAILICLQEPEAIHAVTKELYPSVAKVYGTTSSRVERAIRHAIEVAWDRGDIDVLNAYFGYTIHNDRGKPTNSEFIAMLSDRIRLQYKL